jgi:hypothetical protein
MCCDTQSLTRTRHRVAHLPRECAECSRAIAPGDHYATTVILTGGAVLRGHLCLHCVTAWDLLVPLLPCGFGEAGLLWDMACAVGAFERLPVPECMGGAADLGAALGRLYGAQYDAAERTEWRP